jgi:acetyltransferase-like isoleucine patch superfamily enzyme
MLLCLWDRLLTPWQRVYYTLRLMARVRAMDITVQCDGPVSVSGTGRITIGSRCRLGAHTELQANESGRIVLGSDVRINRGCTIVSYSRVAIGACSIIGEYVTIRDANHGMDPAEPMRWQPHTSAPVTIGEDVWIGRGACILPGVAIGRGAVIGANSVVTHAVPDMCIAAGIPAQIIRQREKP